MAIIRKEKFIFVESAGNHNKFWYIEEHDNGLIRTCWGRVGNSESRSDKQMGASASKEYDKLVKSKLKKGYVQLQTIDSEIANLPKAGLTKHSLEQYALDEIRYDKSNTTITEMIKLFCQENIHTITENTSITWNQHSNVFQTPCGIITSVAIKDARTILDKIMDKVEDGKRDDEWISFTDQYCSIIPQKVYGRFEPIKVFGYKSDIIKQYDILNALEDSLKLIEELNKQNEKNPDKAQKQKLFNISISEVTDTAIIRRIKTKFESTKQAMHSCRNLKVKRIFAINIDKMHDEFVSLQNDWLDQKKQLNMQELWHGTKKSNIISIFKNGFVIPPQNAKHCTGRMFGTGIYLSDQSTKALNYSYGWWSGSRDKNCYMFLCDVMMGREYIPSGSCSSRPFGYDSIFAKAGKSGVINNEMIVPLGQVNPKYLVEFSE
jgi:poly [ADP-ribose] polymerase